MQKRRVRAGICSPLTGIYKRRRIEFFNKNLISRQTFVVWRTISLVIHRNRKREIEKNKKKKLLKDKPEVNTLLYLILEGQLSTFFVLFTRYCLKEETI